MKSILILTLVASLSACASAPVEKTHVFAAKGKTAAAEAQLQSDTRWCRVDANLGPLVGTANNRAARCLADKDYELVEK
jgi:uncharacterized protein YceK